MKLKLNVGNTDRIIRLVLAAILAVLNFSGAVSGAAGIALLILAVVLALTSVVSFCPLYSLLKFSTRGK